MSLILGQLSTKVTLLFQLILLPRLDAPLELLLGICNAYMYIRQGFIHYLLRDKTKVQSPKNITVTTIFTPNSWDNFHPLLLSQSQRKGASL